MQFVHSHQPSSKAKSPFSAKQIEKNDWTSDVHAVRRFVAKIVANGGGDFAEEVHTALAEVLKLRWTADIRLLMHFADAPAHGRLYCPPNRLDNDPNNDSDGSKGKVISLAERFAIILTRGHHRHSLKALPRIG